MLNTQQEIIARLDDYLEKHRRYPKRITVSKEVARELDAIRAEQRRNADTIGLPEKSRLGEVVMICNVQVVADLDPQDVIDYR